MSSAGGEKTWTKRSHAVIARDTLKTFICRLIKFFLIQLRLNNLLHPIHNEATDAFAYLPQQLNLLQGPKELERFSITPQAFSFSFS